MIDMTRRALVATTATVAGATVAGATLAAVLPLRKPRGSVMQVQAMQGIEALHALPEPRKLDLRFTDADGAARSLSDYAGMGVVLNLWATWCVPCVREMPALDDLAKLVAGDGIVVLPVSSDRGGAAVVQRFYGEHGIAHLPVLLDPQGTMARGLNLRGIPTTLLIDKTGQEVGWLEGSADWSSSDAVTVVRRAKG